MTLSPLAGKPAPREMLVDPARLERQYFERRPDPRDPEQRVSFGTSGHRGSPLRGSFTEAHIAAITQAICDFRRMRGSDGPLFMGRDTHALSGPAQRTALEVLAANGVRHRHRTERRSDADAGRLADDPRPQSRPQRASRRRHHRHPLAQSTGGWRLQVQPDAWRAGRCAGDAVDRGPGQRDVAQRQRRGETRRHRRGAERRHDAAGRLRPALRRGSAQRRRYGCHSRGRPQARRRPAGRRRGPLLGADQRDLQARHSPW